MHKHESKLLTPFSTEPLTVYLWHHKAQPWPVSAVITGTVEVNRVGYRVCLEAKLAPGGWTEKHLDLDRLDGSRNAPFNFKAREKFSTTVLHLLQDHVTPAMIAEAKENERQKLIDEINEDLKSLEEKVAERRRELAALVPAAVTRPSPQEQDLIDRLNYTTVGTILRCSDRPFDLQIEGTKAGTPFRAWLPLAAIGDLLSWTSQNVARMTDYPEMVREGDWSGVRDTDPKKIWAIFEEYFCNPHRPNSLTKEAPK